jgi:hypothetical protein
MLMREQPEQNSPEVRVECRGTSKKRSRLRGCVGSTVAFVALSLGPAGAAAQEAGTTDAPSVEQLGWLAGCWEGTLSSGATYEEMWLAPRAGMLVGVARMTRGDRALSFEFMRIGVDDGALVYAAQPGGREATVFRATLVAADSVVFENPAHDFPQRIRYRHDEPDGLVATIDGERGGERRAMEFALRRVACPAPAAARHTPTDPT